MNPQQEKEFYVFGKEQETFIFRTLSKYFDKLQPTKGKYNDWDFEDNDTKIKIELKSRRNSSKKYTSTILGSNKINKGAELIEKGWTIYYFFNFTDKLMFYKLDMEDTFKSSYFNDKFHSFIPIDKLKEI